MKNIIIYFSILALTLSCQQEGFLEDPSVSLQFSEDTIQFDTIFTGFSSITKRLKVYNRYDSDLKISAIRLQGKNNDFFRLNIDGHAKNELKNYTLRKKDSLYIFVELTIDQDDSNNPFLATDSIEFQLNGNSQYMPLIAWGQNAHYLLNEEIDKNATWNANKPYIIYGNYYVDSTAALTIEAGTRVYFHKQASLVVQGSLHVNGTFENPVRFNTDRLEKYYQDKSGQWGTIVLLPGSVNNSINYANINAATAGLQLGSLFDQEYTNLQLHNTKISNTSGAGIYAFGGNVVASNLLIHSFDAAAIVILTSGHYTFANCTFANNTNEKSASSSVVIQSPYVYENYYDPYLGEIYDIPFGGNIEQANFTNCIIQGGSARNGLNITNEGSGAFNYNFNHCIIYAEPDTADYDFDTTDVIYFENNLWTDTLNFVSLDSLNFHLDSGSVAIERGTNELFNKIPELLYDLDNQKRNEQKPDIGAYQFQN